MKDFCLKNYDSENKTKLKVGVLIKQFGTFLGGEKVKLTLAMLVILVNSVANVATPLIMGEAIDSFIKNLSWSDLWYKGLILVAIYLVIALMSYLQTILMGKVGQNVLFKLRSRVFEKIQCCSGS